MIPRYRFDIQKSIKGMEIHTMYNKFILRTLSESHATLFLIGKRRLKHLKKSTTTHKIKKSVYKHSKT